MEVEELANPVSVHKKEAEGVSTNKQCLHKVPAALLVLKAKTSESSYSAIGQFSIIND